MIVIGGLLAIILGIVVRNKLQKRKAAMLAKFSTELKVEERTRLAVELHDSFAQNLTGVSLEIDTATAPGFAEGHYGLVRMPTTRSWPRDSAEFQSRKNAQIGVLQGIPRVPTQSAQRAQ